MAPPAAPPTKVPRNCTLEYTPEAAPLADGGAALDTSAGSFASRTLKAAKKMTSPAASSGSRSAEPASTATPAASTATAPRKTARSCRAIRRTATKGSMSTNPVPTAPRYIPQCSAEGRPERTSDSGTTTKSAISTACRAKMPTLSRASSGSRSTSRNGTVASPWRRGGGSGTTHATMATAARASTPVRAKMPGTPIAFLRKGAATKEPAKATPIVEPMMAIALVRWEGRVRSPPLAGATPEIAPPPLIVRPRVTAHGHRASAQSALPAANTSRPATSTGLRPRRSDIHPKGTCRIAWVRPYAPRATPTSVRFQPGRRSA